MKVEAKIILDGNDITQELSPYLLALKIEDNMDEADTLELRLADKDKKFMGEWFPPRGATIEVELIKDGETFDAGIFEIDEVEFTSPPTVCSVKAVSISQNSGLRQVDESKSWENVLLSKIARDIAEASGLELFYETDYDPQITRAEQGEQSRLAFLQELCADHGLIVKVSDNKLIVVEEESLEKQSPAAVIKWQDIEHLQAKATLQEVYKDCEVTYQHAAQDTLYKARAEDSSKTEGQTLKINRKVNSQAEAEHLAKNELRNKNKKEFGVTLQLPLNFNLQAGNVVTLEDFGFFNGKWLIDCATHTVGNGSTTRIELHKAGDKGKPPHA